MMGTGYEGDVESDREEGGGDIVWGVGVGGEQRSGRVEMKKGVRSLEWGERGVGRVKRGALGKEERVAAQQKGE